MKRFLLISSFAALALLWGCGGKDNPEPIPDSIPKAPTAITLSVSSLSAKAEGESFEITVKSPFVPQVENPSWVMVTAANQSVDKDYNVKMSVTVAKNDTYEVREATLTFKATGATSATLKVMQAAAEKPEDPETDITKTLVTANPLAKTQALYDFLYNQYGKSTVSSVMANVNWNNDIAEAVNKLTGKFPAVNCYDFIHIYVPDGNGWINYKDLSPVTGWYDAGGIVSLMWHFNVPVNKDTTPGKDGSGVTCSPDRTTFKASNALKEGTWEKKWFYGQMDKVITVILLLQEKGIPAIWRPFHEAAGNATLKQSASWATAWFWWGYEGADTFKNLWIAMFEYFKQKGVRNLIWVWTTQNFNGNASQYNQDKDWFPGDAYVDIVARDLYGYDASQNAQEFTEIQKSYPTHMVALGECGWGDEGAKAFSEVSAMWNLGAKWSWFMPWYAGKTSAMVADSWWKDAFKQNFVITRDKVSY